MAESAQSSQILLPGFGLSLEQESSIPNAMDSWDTKPIAVREWSMIALMATIKDKQDWTRKVFDETIVDKWRAEALEFGKNVVILPPSNEGGGEEEDVPDQDNGESIEFDGSNRQKTVSRRMFECCIAELRDDARSVGPNGATSAIDANAVVYMTDVAVSDATKHNLKIGVARLENVPQEKKDWHPGSDEKVLDLVHPSLCPLVYGNTRILPEGAVPLMGCHKYIGKGETIPRPEGVSNYYSSYFQWLPCEVSVDDNEHAKIYSYINNLHPSGNEDLYSAIEEVITQARPLWAACVASTLVLQNTDRMEDVGDGYVERETLDGEDDHGSESESDYVVPEPIQFGGRIRSPSQMSEEINQIQHLFRGKGMQVIVKLANIHLTPEKPSYGGGSWHIEGQINEHICASALYYYDEENITSSYLAFREHVNPDVLMHSAEQHREWGLCAIYGIKDHWGDAQQVLGRIHTREDRLLVFPNVLQHRVSPFELADASKPGHRKILALFLVDPNITIPSTANIPPQQAELWIQDGQMDHVFGHFPNETADQIIDELGFPFSLETAKNLREDLIQERKVFVDGVDDHFRENGYCFCEH